MYYYKCCYSFAMKLITGSRLQFHKFTKRSLRNTSNIFQTKKRSHILLHSNKNKFIKQKRNEGKLYLKFRSTVLYTYPMINIIFYGRNVYNSFPGNIIFYQIFAFPSSIFLRTTFTMLISYLLLILRTVFNPNTQKIVRYHAILANYLDLLLLITYSLRFLVFPFAKWSVIQPLADCILYSITTSIIMYCAWCATKLKKPVLPHFLQKQIDDIVRMFAN
uniref:Chloroplast inner chloroplast membrane translocon Tic20 n=1 Tax=Gymnochlora stellata TaxID=67809 RepID=B5A4F9_GYMST|nr:chloroplast inner chloroplast membrane translocon Tic20 [Gymnochlora stellata]